MKKNVKISVIIVHYRVQNELTDCISSIYLSCPKTSFEIIVVDNDEEKSLKKNLYKKFPNVIYVRNPKNTGYGSGNNLGAARAKGEFLFFLNPDTRLYANAIDELAYFISKEKHFGIVAPILLDEQGKIFSQQGSSELTPLRGIVALSFLNKYFPNNPISKNFWLLHWDKKTLREVDVMPGTAFMIRKKLFNEIGRFDHRFFLYFEENDLCKRVKKNGYRIFMLPTAKVIHLFERSTKKIPGREIIFAQSRFFYFKKHYGLLAALLVDFFCTIHKKKLFFKYLFLGFATIAIK